MKQFTFYLNPLKIKQFLNNMICCHKHCKNVQEKQMKGPNQKQLLLVTIVTP